jgi:glycosyltransferase involved in cell wall biosynthesis
MVANTPPNSGGVSLHIDRLVTNHQTAGHTVDVLWESPLINRFPGALRGYLFGAYAAVVAIRGGYAVVHSHGADGFLIKVVSPRIRNVMTSHGDERESFSMRRDSGTPKWTNVFIPVSKWLRSVRFRMALRGADAVVALHEEEAKAFRRELPSTKAISVIPNGVDPPNLQSNPAIGNVMFLGNWIERKGCDLVPEIFRLLHENHPTTHLALIGPPTDTIEEFQEDLRPYVSAFGWCSRQEVELHLSRADCLLFPSRAEGMPLAVLEAMSYGVPIVSTDLPGIRSCAEGCGVFVENVSPTSFAVSILKIVSDRNLRESLSRTCTMAVGNFTWSTISNSVLAQYEL